MSIHQCNNREELEKYIISQCDNHATTILIKGSTAHGEINEFSDFDIEVYGEKAFNPKYLFAFFNQKVILITILYMGKIEGEKTDPPKKIKIVKGHYTKSMDKAIFSEGNPNEYLREEWVVRKRQVIIDELFKYLRHKDEKTLEDIQKKLNF